MPKPRILFRVDANAKIGWGHFYRSLSLAGMLDQSFQISFAMAGADDHLRDMLLRAQYELVSLPELPYTTPDERGDNQFKCDLINHLENTDIVVLDGYWFGEDYRKALRDYPVKLAVIEDEEQGHYQADLIINHAPGLDQSRYSSDNESTLYALGPEHALLRPAFLQHAQQNKSEGTEAPDSKEVFIAFGGSDHHDFSGFFSKTLLTGTNYHVKVVLGNGYAQNEQMLQLAEQFPGRLSIRRNLSESEMLAEMSGATCGIVPSSGILFECLASRLPVFTGYYTQNQWAIYNGWRKTAAVLPLDNLLDLSEKQFLEKMKSLDLEQIRSLQYSLVDGQSGERFLQLFKTLVA